MNKVDNKNKSKEKAKPSAPTELPKPVQFEEAKPPSTEYIFEKKTTNIDKSTEHVNFLISVSKKPIYFFDKIKPFYNRVFNSGMIIQTETVKIPVSNSFNITSELKLEDYKEELLKTPSLLTDPTTFTSWLSGKKEMKESEENKYSVGPVKREKTNYLCDNINFLMSTLFGNGNISVYINNIPYTIIGKEWVNININKNAVCDTSALSLLYKSEYSKFYKREFSLSSSQQSLQKARDDSKKLNEYLKGKHINYFKIMQSKLQLASAIANETLISIRILQNEWLKVKSSILLGSGIIDKLEIDTYELKEIVDETSANERAMFITKLFQKLETLYVNIQYFSKMMLETYSQFEKEKDKIYDSRELITFLNGSNGLHTKIKLLESSAGGGTSF